MSFTYDTATDIGKVRFEDSGTNKWVELTTAKEGGERARHMCWIGTFGNPSWTVAWPFIAMFMVFELAVRRDLEPA